MVLERVANPSHLRVFRVQVSVSPPYWKVNPAGLGTDWKSVGSERTVDRVHCFPPVLVGESLRLRACLENSAVLRDWDSSSPPTAI